MTVDVPSFYGYSIFKRLVYYLANLLVITSLILYTSNYLMHTFTYTTKGISM